MKHVYNLRDWFAGQALMSMLSEPGRITDSTYKKAAELSYKFADAMIKERALNRPPPDCAL